MCFHAEDIVKAMQTAPGRWDPHSKCHDSGCCGGYKTASAYVGHNRTYNIELLGPGAQSQIKAVIYLSTSTVAGAVFSCEQATSGREDAIDVTLTLDEMGTVFCSVVRNGLPHPSRFFVAAEGAHRGFFFRFRIFWTQDPPKLLKHHLSGFQSSTSFYQPVPQLSGLSTQFWPILRLNFYSELFLFLSREAESSHLPGLMTLPSLLTWLHPHEGIMRLREGLTTMFFVGSWVDGTMMNDGQLESTWHASRIFTPFQLSFRVIPSAMLQAGHGMQKACNFVLDFGLLNLHCLTLLDIAWRKFDIAWHFPETRLCMCRSESACSHSVRTKCFSGSGANVRTSDSLPETDWGLCRDFALCTGCDFASISLIIASLIHTYS